MRRQIIIRSFILLVGMSLTLLVTGQGSALKKWQRGRGWGWVWGPNDEVGALNEMTDEIGRAHV